MKTFVARRFRPVALLLGLTIFSACSGGGFQRNLGGGGVYCPPNQMDSFEIPANATRIDLSAVRISSEAVLVAQQARVFFSEKVDVANDRSWILIEFNHRFSTDEESILEDQTAGPSQISIGCARGFEVNTPSFNYSITAPTFILPDGSGQLTQARQTTFDAEWKVEPLRAFSVSEQAEALSTAPLVIEDLATTAIDFYQPDVTNNPSVYNLRLEKTLETEFGGVLIINVTYRLIEPE